MVKIIRRPLTDINGNDFMTGKPIKSEEVEQAVGLKKKLAKRMKAKQKEAKTLGRTDGKILVEGFGRVSI